MCIFVISSVLIFNRHVCQNVNLTTLVFHSHAARRPLRGRVLPLFKRHVCYTINLTTFHSVLIRSRLPVATAIDGADAYALRLFGFRRFHTFLKALRGAGADVVIFIAGVAALRALRSVRRGGQQRKCLLLCVGCVCAICVCCF